MPEPLITVTRRGEQFVATAPGLAYEGISHTSARCAATSLIDRAHGTQWFLKYRIEQETATFRLDPARKTRPPAIPHRQS